MNAQNDRVTPARQMEVLQAIDALIRRDGWPPSIREIAAELCLVSNATIHYHLGLLEAWGLIVRGPKGQNRSLRITTIGQAALELAKLTPVQGEVG